MEDPSTIPNTEKDLAAAKFPTIDEEDEDTVGCLVDPSGSRERIRLRLSEGKRSDGSYCWAFGRTAKYALGASRRISGHHFHISMNAKNPGIVMLTDTSTNGTFLNGDRLPKNRGYLLTHGDEILIGHGIPEDELRLLWTCPKRLAKEGINATYELGALLGHGAFAVVRQAVNRSTGETCAVKIIDKSRLSPNVSVKRETDILEQLKHPYIVELKDFYEDSSSYYLVMEYVSGGDLMDFILDNGKIDERTAQTVMRQIFEAIAYVHSLGISHRDLKPDNIIIASDDPVVVKVSDFGLAKITKSGSVLKTFCGTLAYLAPEVMRSRNRTSASQSPEYSNCVDIWSLGCLMYVILTGYLPFEGNTQEQLYRNVLDGKFLREPLMDVHLSEKGFEFISKLLEVDPQKRPTASEALQFDWLRVDDDDGADDDEMVDDSHEEQIRNDNNLDRTNADVDVANHAATPDSAEISPDLIHGESESDTPASGDLCTNMSPAQNAPVTIKQYSVRDIDCGDERPIAPANWWLKLATCPESIPFKDVYICKDSFLVGRQRPNNSCDLPIDMPVISAKHCEFSKVKTTSGKLQAWFTMYSTNPAFVNNIRLVRNEKIMLNNGDRITLHQMKVAGGVSKLKFDVVLSEDEEYEKRPGSSNGNSISRIEFGAPGAPAAKREHSASEDYSKMSVSADGDMEPEDSVPLKRKRHLSAAPRLSDSNTNITNNNNTNNHMSVLERA